MRTRILSSFMAVLLSGCASDNQKKAMDEVARTYEATTGYSKGFNNTITYFRITAGNSEILDVSDVVKAASNIALLVYDNFSEKERKDYSHIEVEISKKINPQDKVTRNYEVSTLAAPSKQAKIFDNFSEAILVGDFQLMASLIDPQYRKDNDAENVKNYLQKFIDVNGKIIGYKRIGYGLRVFENKTTNYEFSGMFIFENNKKLNYRAQTYDNTNSPYIYTFSLD